MFRTPPRLRSALFVPGANERALEKARELPADALILDLEDSVAPAAKAQARERIGEAVLSGGYAGRIVAIRVNAIGTEWHSEDLAAVARARPDALLLPKLNDPRDLAALERAMAEAAVPEQTQIWAMLESPAAVLRAGEIGRSSSRLEALIVGTNDLLAELGAEPMPGRASLLTSLSLCVLAARAAAKTVLDGVYNDVRDLDGFEAECLQARRLGFDGKTLINPAQIDACHRAFSPSPEAIEHARRVIGAFEQVARGGGGVATLDGLMIEQLHVDGARRVLAQADLDS